MIASSVARIEVHKNELAVWLKAPQPDAANVDQACDGNPSGSTGDTNATPLLIPWCKPPSRKAREILLPASGSWKEIRPIKSERRLSLLKSVARGRKWLDEIVSGAVQDVEQIARRHKCSVRHVNMTISMAFIAPGLVKAAVEGRLPCAIGVARLRDAPAEWSLQFARLGLAYVQMAAGNAQLNTAIFTASLNTLDQLAPTIFPPPARLLTTRRNWLATWPTEQQSYPEKTGVPLPSERYWNQFRAINVLRDPAPPA